MPDGLHPGATGYSLYVTPVILRSLGLSSHIPAGSVMLDAGNQRPAEPQTSGGLSRNSTITVTRGGYPDGDLVVPLSIGGSASNGSDYTTLPGSITIPAGSASASITLSPLSDNASEGDETLTIGISPAPGITLASPAKASLILEDRPFDAWRKANFTAAELLDPLISGDDADPDGDGIKNLLEFYTHHLPKSPDQNSPATLGSETISGQAYLTLTYDRLPSPGLSGIIQTSPDLNIWNSGPAFVSETILSDSGLLQSVKARSLAPIGSGKEFLRLKVTCEP